MKTIMRIFTGQWNWTECNVVYVIVFMLWIYALTIDGIFDLIEWALIAAFTFTGAVFNWRMWMNTKGGGS